jgi:hypothetical protein
MYSTKRGDIYAGLYVASVDLNFWVTKDKREGSFKHVIQPADSD